MGASQNKEYLLKSQKRDKSKVQFSERNMQTRYDHRLFLTISLEELYKRFLVGIQRLIVAAKYRFYQYTAGMLDRVRLPWFKIGLATLVIFIVTQKDIQFTVNMRAPLGGFLDDNREDEANVEQMGLVKTVSVHEFTPPNADPIDTEEINKKKAQAYISRFSKVAATEMEKFDIPASIHMAQAIYESRAGDHPDTRQSNNHFGKPMSDASYNSAWENWRAHSIFIASEFAEESWGYDYKKWAKGLEKAGYNKTKNYASKLIDIVEEYKLYQLDIR